MVLVKTLPDPLTASSSARSGAPSGWGGPRVCILSPSHPEPPRTIILLSVPLPGPRLLVPNSLCPLTDLILPLSERAPSPSTATGRALSRSSALKKERSLCLAFKGAYFCTRPVVPAPGKALRPGAISHAPYKTPHPTDAQERPRWTEW